VTQEFHVSVTPVGNDRYLVRTERVAPGVPLAEEQLTWAVEDWLAQARQLMNNPLLSLLQGDPARVTPGEHPLDRLPHPPTSADLNQSSLSLVALGQQLYSAIFQGTLRDSWVTAQGIAQHRGEALRLRLGVKGTLLPRLPWEVLYSNDMPIERVQSSLPLASGTHVIFSRYQPGARLVGDGAALTIEPDQPLRILMVISAPTDQERLELQHEVNHLQQELRSQSIADGTAAPDIQLTILSQPGREQLTQALEQGQFQVLHYAGHSDMGVAGGSLYLVNSRTGLTEILSGDDLAGLLVNNGVRLAVFNSCRGAHMAAEPKGERDRNLAEALVSRGIPAVLAMAEQIPDHVALTLTWLFYRNLKQGYPVDLSLSRARQGLISTYGSNQLYWALPILYQHPEFDGYLTPGDRNFDNPADRLVLMPQGYSALPIAAVEPAPDLPLAPEPGEEEMVWNAVLEEDDLGDWADDLEYPEDGDEEDAEVVADLLGQLNLRPLPGISERVAAQIPQGASLSKPPVRSARQEPVPQPPLRSEAASNTQINAQITVLDPSPLTTQQDAAVETYVPPVQHIPVESLQGKRTDSQKYSSHRSMAKPGLGAVERKALLPFAGAAGALAIALLGYWLAPQVQWAGLLSKIPDAPSLLATNQDLQNRETRELTAIATDRFTKGQLPEGNQALSILLDRGALPEAAAIIQAIPTAQVDDPRVSYLRGRLAWQSIQTGNPDYQISDVVRDWESAVKAQPDAVEFHKALGFAYYAQNRPREAIQAWADALDILEVRPASSGEASEAIEVPDATNAQPDAETLTIYAGIALALRQVVNDPNQPQADLSGKANKIYQMVLSRDPVNFLPQALGKSWLWSESAIKDWQALAQES
jgi:tetratricopeptide (TPR) repeat protein